MKSKAIIMNGKSGEAQGSLATSIECLSDPGYMANKTSYWLDANRSSVEEHVFLQDAEHQ